MNFEKIQTKISNFEFLKLDYHFLVLEGGKIGEKIGQLELKESVGNLQYHLLGNENKRY